MHSLTAPTPAIIAWLIILIPVVLGLNDYFRPTRSRDPQFWALLAILAYLILAPLVSTH